MFEYNQNAEFSSEYQCQFPLPDYVITSSSLPAFPPSPLFLLPQMEIPNEHDSVPSALMSELGYSSSGCSSYGTGSPTSLTHTSPTLIQRSHSLHRNLEVYCPPNSSPSGCFESETDSVRKVLSTGDLQVVNLGQNNQGRWNSPLANESSIIESMNRASPYSPEEKKERIERYRSKRSLRNFNKKIQYECRKSLADSRPRIRGRFARNDEIQKPPQSQWEDDHRGFEEDDDNWINFVDAYSA